MTISALFNLFNGMGVTLGLPNFDSEFPTCIGKIFADHHFNGESLEFRSIKHETIFSLVLDSSRVKESLFQLFDRTLMTEPVMQCKDAYGYKGIALHIRGKERSEKIINLNPEKSFLSFENASSMLDFRNITPMHRGEPLPLKNLEIICYIFRNFTSISVLDKARNRCLQNTVSLRNSNDERSALEEDVSNLFKKETHLSESLLLKLFTGTHPDLQLGEDPDFKLFQEDSVYRELLSI